jgi:hypothetical protein
VQPPREFSDNVSHRHVIVVVVVASALIVGLLAAIFALS